MRQDFEIKKRTYLKIIANGRERNIGFIDWKRQCYISKREHEHTFFKYNGLGMSKVILDFLIEKNIEKIIMVYQGKFLITSVNKFYDKGIKYQDGNDIQLILPLEEFEDTGKKVVEMQKRLK